MGSHVIDSFIANSCDSLHGCFSNFKSNHFCSYIIANTCNCYSCCTCIQIVCICNCIVCVFCQACDYRFRNKCFSCINITVFDSCYCHIRNIFCSDSYHSTTCYRIVIIFFYFIVYCQTTNVFQCWHFCLIFTINSCSICHNCAFWCCYCNSVGFTVVGSFIASCCDTLHISRHDFECLCDSSCVVADTCDLYISSSHVQVICIFNSKISVFSQTFDRNLRFDCRTCVNIGFVNACHCHICNVRRCDSYGCTACYNLIIVISYFIENFLRSYICDIRFFTNIFTIC